MYSTTKKYTQAMQFERQVAAPAPNTSSPSGSSTNMKTGSRIILSTPPSIMPKPAAPERPTLLSRFDSTLESTVGIPPTTMTHMAYWRAYSYVCSSAPSRPSSGRMSTQMSTAKSRATARPRYIEKTPTRRASSSLPCPSRRDMREPPPTPARPEGWTLGRLPSQARSFRQLTKGLICTCCATSALPTSRG